jgi:CRISPR-associated protein Csm4
MLYRYRIIPESPLITPLMSDTFFGHFCWAIRFREGEDYLADLLGYYGNDRAAPVLFSSAFVSGRLPRPTLPSMRREQIREFVRKHFGEDKREVFGGLSRIKTWSKHRYVPVERWLRLKDDYSEEKLYESFAAGNITADQEAFEIEVAASNMIDRVSGTVPQEGGGLFQREKIWYHQGVALDMYVEINREELVSLTSWFLTEYLPKSGFGADKSVGMGCLTITPDESFDPEIFEVKDPNARLSLSLASFPGMNAYPAFYRLMTKFGKLGGTFAVVSPTGGDPNPFKKPILMYEPGAVFFCSSSLSDRPLLSRIHSDSRIRHCGVPITLPFRISEEERYVPRTA